MKRFNWQIFLGVSLVLLSALFYYVHYVIFRDAHHIFIYLIGDIAFVFIEVLLVTLIIHQLLSEREKRAMFEKLNIVIGAFFSEVGTTLLKSLTDFDQDIDRTSKDILMLKDWSGRGFSRLKNRILKYDCKIDTQKGDLEGLIHFLNEKRNFLLRLLENQNLIEHESFTNLLWAIFHLDDELSSRKDLTELPQADYIHISGDIKRAYIHLIQAWLDYMKHMNTNYPYLFSLAMRMNPFDPNASPEVK
ncbi:MAG: hypothetical protein SWO11_12045 [Thermodesulfobacteriota bacterium]|nr:hypothetical protein [Thermodesulfobacteriota bacterium]